MKTGGRTFPTAIDQSSDPAVANWSRMEVWWRTLGFLYTRSTIRAITARSSAVMMAPVGRSTSLGCTAGEDEMKRRRPMRGRSGTFLG